MLRRLHLEKDIRWYRVESMSSETGISGFDLGLAPHRICDLRQVTTLLTVKKKKKKELIGPSTQD